MGRREMRDVLARAYERDRDGPTVRLVLEEVGAARRITVVAPDAAAVEIRGDFTDWEPVALTRVDATTFALPWSVAPGVYRLVVRVDGGVWTVPVGARVEEGEFGAAVGVVVVPGR